MLRFSLPRGFCAPLIAVALVSAQSPALAQTGSAEAQAEEAVAAPRVAALAREGYRDIKVEWTWLGRLRIVAWLDGRRREVILHPTTGEVLRDLTLPPETAYAQGDDAPSGNPSRPATEDGIEIGATSGPDYATTSTVTLDGTPDDARGTDPSVSVIGIGVAP